MPRLPENPVSVVPLTMQNAPLWLELETEHHESLDYLIELLTYMTSHPRCLFLLAVRGARVVGRLEVRPLGEAGMGLMAPRFQEDLVGEELIDTAEALIAYAAATMEGATYVEAGTDAAPTFWTLAWQAALGRQRFKLVAESHEYVHRCAAGAGGPPERGPMLSLVSAQELPSEQLEAIYKQTYYDTPDGAHRYSLESYRARLDALRHMPALRHDPALWFVAFERGRAVGLVLCALETGAFGRVGWVLEIGVLPARRGQGTGGHLLRQAVRRLGERGCRVIKSRIDDANAPSIQMHLSNGFVPQPGVARLFQRRLAAI